MLLVLGQSTPSTTDAMIKDGKQALKSKLEVPHVGNEVSVTTKYFKTESFIRCFVFRVEMGVKMKLLISFRLLT